MKFTEKPMERITKEAEDMLKEIESLEPVSISKLDSGSTMAVFVDIMSSGTLVPLDLLIS